MTDETIRVPRPELGNPKVYTFIFSLYIFDELQPSKQCFHFTMNLQTFHMSSLHCYFIILSWT